MYAGIFEDGDFIVSFSTPPVVIFKVKRLYFKVKFLNFASFCQFLCLSNFYESSRDTIWGWYRDFWGRWFCLSVSLSVRMSVCLSSVNCWS